MGFWKQSKKPGPDGRRQTFDFEEPRWRLSHPLTILKVDGRSGRHTLLGYAENISRHGMMIGTISPKEVGSQHQIEFALPQPIDRVLRCSCRVVWARPYSVDGRDPGMGLELLELSEAEADSLDSLWRDAQHPETRARRTWSDFDQAWVPWTPRSAANKGISG